MHPRVGPTGTRDGYGKAKHRAESLLQLPLHGASLRLRLPAEEVGAVVCYVEEVSHTLLLLLRKKSHRDPSRGALWDLLLDGQPILDKGRAPS